MRIRQNIIARHTNHTEKAITKQQAKHLKKLPSSLPINRTTDNATGLSISKKTLSQINLLTAAGKNVQDGISLLQTTEGALGETHSMLNRMVALAEQSSNPTHESALDQASLQQEFDQLYREIDRIAQDTHFNGIPLLKFEGDQTNGNVLRLTSLSTNTISMPTELQSNMPIALQRMLSANSVAPLSDAPGVVCGAFTVYGDAEHYSYENGVLTISGDVTVEGNGIPTTDIIKMESGITANVTIKNVNIDASSRNTAACSLNGSTVNLKLTGTNVLTGGASHAGLAVGRDAVLTITNDSTGILHASGGDLGAGIGGDNGESGGTIYIKGGTISAMGGKGGAGIGGGNGGNGGTIRIEGGTITAIGGNNSAGIGGGNGGNGGNIHIEGGLISAMGGINGAGIGGGNGEGGGIILIKGGTISAIGGIGGAGIGGGMRGDGGAITITDAMLNAIFGGETAAAIGSGGNGDGGVITITDAMLNAIQGGDLGAAIGSGENGNAGVISITNSSLQVIQGGDLGAAIGSGENGSAGVITITNSSLEEIQGGNGGAAIGSGGNGKGGVITITNSSLEAVRGGDWGAAIGGGSRSDGGEINITNSSLHTILGGDLGAGIGGGLEGDSGIIAISKSTITDVKGSESSVAIGSGNAGGGNASMVSRITISDHSIVFTGASGQKGHIGDNESNSGNNRIVFTAADSLVVQGADGKVYGNIAITNDLTINNGMCIMIPNGSSLSITQGITFTNNGQIINNGVINNQGTLFNENAIANNAAIHMQAGALTNHGTISDNGIINYLSNSLTVTVNDLTLDANTNYPIFVNGIEKVYTTDYQGALILDDIPRGGTSLALYVDDDRYGAILQVTGDTSVSLRRTTCHATLEGVQLNGNTAYTVSINGKEKTLRTDADGSLTIKGISNGKTTISLTHADMVYTGTRTINEDGAFLLTQENDLTNAVGDGVIRFQIGTGEQEILDIAVQNMDCISLGLENLSVTNPTYAAEALTHIKDAVDVVSAQRSYIGTLQNQLEHTLHHLHTAAKNLTASEIRIRDTDMAEEILIHMKQNILSQANQAMSAQAGSLSEGVLPLLE